LHAQRVRALCCSGKPHPFLCGTKYCSSHLESIQPCASYSVINEVCLCPTGISVGHNRTSACSSASCVEFYRLQILKLAQDCHFCFRMERDSTLIKEAAAFFIESVYVVTKLYGAVVHKDLTLSK